MYDTTKTFIFFLFSRLFESLMFVLFCCCLFNGYLQETRKKIKQIKSNQNNGQIDDCFLFGKQSDIHHWKSMNSFIHSFIFFAQKFCFIFLDNNFK